MQVLHRLAMKAVRDTVVAGKDVIFLAGDTATASYFKVGGEITYFHSSEKDSVSNATWVAEHCLWTPWVHALALPLAVNHLSLPKLQGKASQVEGLFMLAVRSRASLGCQFTPSGALG